MLDQRKTKWVVFAIGSLILPMPYYLFMAAGTMPLAGYLIATLYSILIFDFHGLVIAVFLVIDTFLLLFVSNYSAKVATLITEPKFRIVVIVAAFVAMAFIPWHIALGVNRPESHDTFGYYSHTFDAYNEMLHRKFGRSG